MSKNSQQRYSADQRKELAEQVRTIREASTLTQDELATQAGVSRQTISNLERGAVVPQDAKLRKIMSVLGISDPSEPEHHPQTRAWLGLIGGVMDKLQPDSRDRAGAAAMIAVTRELNNDIRANVAHEIENGSSHELPENVEETWALAAHPVTEEPIEHTP